MKPTRTWCPQTFGPHCAVYVSMCWDVLYACAYIGGYKWCLSPPAGKVRSLSTALWSLTHLTALHLSDNSLSRIPPEIAKLHNLMYLDLSSNKIRSLPAELGNMVSLRWGNYTSHDAPERSLGSPSSPEAFAFELLCSFYVFICLYYAFGVKAPFSHCA